MGFLREFLNAFLEPFLVLGEFLTRSIDAVLTAFLEAVQEAFLDAFLETSTWTFLETFLGTLLTGSPRGIPERVPRTIPRGIARGMLAGVPGNTFRGKPTVAARPEDRATRSCNLEIRELSLLSSGIAGMAPRTLDRQGTLKTTVILPCAHPVGRFLDFIHLSWALSTHQLHANLCDSRLSMGIDN